LNFEFSEQRAPRMLASIWPSRDENHGQDGHNLELETIVNRCKSVKICGQLSILNLPVIDALGVS